MLNVTYFIAILLLIQGSVTLQYASVALIYPQRSEITVNVATNLTLGCRGAEPMSWTFNNADNGPYFNSSTKNIANIYNDKEVDYKHETILTVYNVSGENIGFYYCHGTNVNFDTARRSTKIYVFVHDDNYLAIKTSKINKYVVGLWHILVPCRPTAPDINITLICGDTEVSVNSGNYTAKQQFGDYVASFHPYYGFTLEIRYSRSWSFLDCECIFRRKNKMSTIRLSPHVRDTYLEYDEIIIEGPYTVDVGGDLQLQCLILLDRNLPYNNYLPYWKFPITEHTHNEHLHVFKFKTYTYIMNTIKMHNISTEDERYYQCQIDGHLEFSDASRTYVYVNDKKSNLSAPRIYSPPGGEIQINEGVNITLRCAGSRPVTWARPRNARNQIEHVSNLDGLFDTSLQLTKVSYFDTGLYHCHENGSLTDHPFKSDKIQIFVKHEQKFYVPLKKIEEVYPYANVTVPCLPTSRDMNVSLSMMFHTRDPNTYKWSELQMTNPVIYAYDPREGFIVQMPGLQFGVAIVTCTFLTESANSTLIFEYHIAGFSEEEPFISGPDEDLVFVGQILELCCTARVYYNVPADALHWTHPNHFISSKVIEEINIIRYKQGYLLMNKLILHDAKSVDEGRYFCHLTSHNATANKFISVYDQFGVRRPVIQNLTYDYAYIGQPLVLRCKVVVNHNIGFQMSWITPNHTDIQNLNIEYIRDVRNTTGEIILKIDNITEESQGNYSCNVFYSTNSGNYTTKHILVKKGEKPRIVTSSFKEQEEIVVALEATVNLTCSAAGDPKPVITWMKNTTKVQRLGQHFGFSADNSELTIYYVQRSDAGLYTCIAENPFGRDSRAANLRLQTVSFIPYYVIVIFLIVLIIVAPVLLARRINKYKKLRKVLNEAGFIKFKAGELQRVNPYLNITEQAALLSYDTKWEIPRNLIALGCNLGSGYFGLVVEATVTNYFDGESEKTVAIKMLHRNCNVIELNSLLCELKIMSHLEKHVNLINLLGACTDKIAEGNLLLVIEYCEHGSLSNYLRANRCNFVNLIDPNTELICFPVDDNDSLQELCVCELDAASRGSLDVSTLQLLRWALQVARGMEFLASKQILHGDLAVRNVLLDENYVVKISDFGLSKTLSSSGYYKKTSRCQLPVKWMAIESIRDKTFSTQSDVWAFGVVLWELFSLARTPYAELEADFCFYRKLESGYRLERPDYSTREIYQVMRECWCERPSNRPTFSCLVRTLQDLLQNPNEHLSAKMECASSSAAASMLAAGQANHTATSDWIALDILPRTSTVHHNTTTRL